MESLSDQLMSRPQSTRVTSSIIFFAIRVRDFYQ